MIVGTIPVLAIVECRDRTTPADVTWIEQVAQKRNDLNAAKAMVVSAAGFTESAIQKAAHLGIEVRHLKDVSVESLHGWFRGGDLQFSTKRAQIVGCSIGIDQASIVGELLQSELSALFDRPEYADPLFRNKNGGASVSIRDIWRHIHPSSLALSETVPRDGTAISHEMELNFPKPEERMQIVLPTGSADVIQIVLTVAFWVERESIPVSRAYAYQSSDSTVARGIQYPLKIDGRTITMEIHRTADHRIGVTLTPTEDGNG